MAAMVHYLHGSKKEDTLGARSFVESNLPANRSKGNPDIGTVSAEHWAKKKARQQSIVDQIVKETGNGPISAVKVGLIARTLGRSKDVVKEMIDQARLNLADDAVDYVDMHKAATQMALANGDAKSLEVATRAAQWAMKNTSLEGKHVVEQAQQVSSGTVINIGVKLGGLISQTEPAAIEGIVVGGVPPSLPPSKVDGETQA